MKSIGIAIKPGAENAKVVAKKLLDWLEPKGLEIFLGDGAEEVVSDKVGKVIPRQELTSTCDLVVILGGDGTFISVCRYPSKHDCLVLGVNLGTLGFLTEVNTEELFGTLEKVLQGSVKTETRSLLKATVVGPDGSSACYYAFNDVVLSKQALARIFELNLMIDGDRAAALRGDGVIVSTPAGSTGYSLAAGGSIVHPSVDALLIAPICPHSLSSRPLVIPGNSKLELSLDSGDEVYLTVDGQEGAPFLPGTKILIETSDYKVNIIKSEKRDYFEVLRNKLHWRPSIANSN